MLVTATADWTTFDTIGGYMPAESGDKLVFRPGTEKGGRTETFKAKSLRWKILSLGLRRCRWA